MQTILVPTDFSDTAKNAALYAMEFASSNHSKKIVLYNAYQPPVNADPTIPAIQFLDVDALKQTSNDNLQKFLSEIRSSSTTGVEIETLNDFSLLSANIDDACEKVNASLIIMGITGGGKIEEALIGSNTVSVAQHATVPVIIVPADCSFRKINHVLLACDFKKVVETTPVEMLKTILNTTKAKLHVINISKQAKEDNDRSYEALMLDNLLKGYSPEYHFIEDKDFTNAINQFAEQNNIDLIITIPKKHGWFEGLFRKHHTKSLAFHTHLPLMVVHE
jgi:nucleotide-binding universal stress UspA family protein